MIFKKRIIFTLIVFFSFFSMLLFIPIFGICTPFVRTSPSSTAIVDEPYIHQLEAVDGFGSELSYHLTKAPDGMSIDNSTGLIKWIPNERQVGKNEVNLEIINNKSRKILKLLKSLSTEEQLDTTSIITYGFSIEVNTPKKETVKFDSNRSSKDDQDCSEANEVSYNSIFANISGGG